MQVCVAFPFAPRSHPFPGQTVLADQPVVEAATTCLHTNSDVLWAEARHVVHACSHADTGTAPAITCSNSTASSLGTAARSLAGMYVRTQGVHHRCHFDSHCLTAIWRDSWVDSLKNTTPATRSPHSGQSATTCQRALTSRWCGLLSVGKLEGGESGR